MTKSDSSSNSSTPGRRSKAKQASVASVGATLLLVAAYLIASWMGIPVDDLLSSGTDGPGQRPVAVDTQGEDADATPSATSDTPPRTKAPPATSGTPRTKAPPATAPASSPFKIPDVTVHNLDGDVAFRGTVDLTATMKRIDAGRRLDQFRNDGSTFQNRERRLPIKERGYYKEFVHPTPKLRGPGPQRVVTGKEGEAYYTFDHYKTFQKIR